MSNRKHAERLRGMASQYRSSWFEFGSHDEQACDAAANALDAADARIAELEAEVMAKHGDAKALDQHLPAGWSRHSGSHVYTKRLGDGYARVGHDGLWSIRTCGITVRGSSGSPLSTIRVIDAATRTAEATS